MIEIVAVSSIVIDRQWGPHFMHLTVQKYNNPYAKALRVYLISSPITDQVKKHFIRVASAFICGKMKKLGIILKRDTAEYDTYIEGEHEKEKYL